MNTKHLKININIYILFAATFDKHLHLSYRIQKIHYYKEKIYVSYLKSFAL